MFDFLWKFSKKQKQQAEDNQKLKDEIEYLRFSNEQLKAEVKQLNAALREKSRPKQTNKGPRKKHGCGKHCYSSSSKAKKASRVHSTRVRAYHCKECHAWHVTTR